AAPAPGTAALSVAAGASATAAPGAFGSVNVGNGGKLRLPAGNYDFADLTLGNNARLEAEGAVQIHVAGRLAGKNGVFIGGATGAAWTCDDGNPCTTDGCDASGTCTHTPALVGTSCSDGNACNGAEACDGAGSCRPGTPVTCAASDQCHNAGVCDPATGACSNP